jgi:hypothetical protein
LKWVRQVKGLEPTDYTDCEPTAGTVNPPA